MLCALLVFKIYAEHAVITMETNDRNDSNSRVRDRVRVMEGKRGVKYKIILRTDRVNVGAMP